MYSIWKIFDKNKYLVQSEQMAGEAYVYDLYLFYDCVNNLNQFLNACR